MDEKKNIDSHYNDSTYWNSHCKTYRLGKINGRVL